MRGIDVALTPGPLPPADVCIVIDCIRAATVAAHALAAGYRRLVCAEDVDEARSLAAEIGADAVLGGERGGRRIPGFSLGNSPAEYERQRGAALVLCTTNGTRALVAGAEVASTLLFGALVNLRVVAAAAAAAGGDVLIVCAGSDGRFALDDAYVAGRYVDRLLRCDPSFEPADAASAALAVARAYPRPHDALVASASARALERIGLGDDVAACARESALAVAPRMAARGDGFVELVP